MLIGPNILSSNTFAAAGSTQATATVLDQDFCVISSGTGGVRLPQEQRGLKVTITNKTGSAVNVYPPPGGQINALSVNAAYSLEDGVARVFSSHTATSDTTNWLTEAPEPHTHPYLPLTGGTLSGQLQVADSTTLAIGSYATFAGLFRNPGAAQGIGLGANGSGSYIQSFDSKPLYINASGNAVVFGNDLRSRAQGRFTGWYNTNVSDENGAALEVGVSAGYSYVLGYDRTNGGYRSVRIDGTDLELLTSNNSRLKLTAAGSADFTGKIQSTGWNGNYSSVLGMQVGISGGQGYVHCYNGTTGTYGQLNVVGTPVNINNGYLWVGSAPAVQGTDSWLRLNNSNSFSSGIYTPGSLRADGTIYTGGSGEIQSATGYRWAPDTNFYIWNTSGYNYGSWRIGGARNGYVGVILDTGNYPTFMSGGGSTCGVYVQNAGFWSWYEDGSTFQVSHNLTCGGNITAFSSDARLKDDVEPITSALDKVCKLQGVSFKWKDTGLRTVGFIAQDVERVVPEVVTEYKNANDGDTYKAVAYGNLVGLLTEAIKELRAEVNTLRQQTGETA